MAFVGIGEIPRLDELDEMAREWAQALEAAESKRSCVALQVARRTVARRLGVAPGSLDELARGRTKGVRAWFFEKLRAAFVAEAQAEIQRLKHARDVALAAGLGNHKEQMDQVEAHLNALRGLIGGGQ